ncbi:uncharacterized protein (DUF488 family) [Dysgonomonadaceae bacterium PH5-43]|nr:uncharacterized protein (DUF488 family) [Dysgonomonadaceae bacterium PH5-43]
MRHPTEKLQKDKLLFFADFISVMAYFHYLCPMLYYRRKILLALLETFGGRLTAKRLQKYLFLFTRKQTEKSFDFVPYKYGCFSFQANQDIATLGKYGYLTVTESENGRCIELNKEYTGFCSLLNLFDRQYLISVKNEFGALSQTDLIRYTYINYPFWATKSSIAEQILSKEEFAEINTRVRSFSEPVLFSIGYEGITLETYINKLIISDVKVLCDVRKNAFSQKYGFSKKQLEQACKGVGILYIHVPQLGIESEERQDLRSQKDYDLLFEKYERLTLVNRDIYINQVRELIIQYKRVAVTCFEKNPAQCHRTRVAKKLMSISEDKYTFKNL